MSRSAHAARVTLAGLALAGSLSLAAGGCGSHAANRTPVPSGVVALTEHTRSELAPEFAVFGRPANAAAPSIHAIPREMARNLESLDRTSILGRDGGLDPDLASYVATFHATEIWLVPGTAGVCLETYSAAAGGDGSCVTTSEAEDGLLIETSTPPRRDTASAVSSLPVFVAGLAADSISRVHTSTVAGPLSVSTANGMSSSVAVKSNVYWFTEPNGRAAVTVTGAGGFAARVPAS